MPTTSNWGFPYPAGSDPAAIHTDIQALADALDNGTLSVLMGSSGLLAARPTPTGSEKQVYFATDVPAYYFWNGTTWTNVGPDPLEDDEVTTAKILDDAVTTAKIDDGAVTEAKLASDSVSNSKIADDLKPSGTAAAGDEALRAIGSTASTVVAGNDARLSAAAAGTASVRALGTSSTNAAAGDDVRIRSPFDAVRKAVRGVSTSNIANLSSVADTAIVSGLTAASGDRFLLAGQSTASQNGIYTWSANALTRAEDMNASAHLATGITIPVMEGEPFIGSTWVLSTTGSMTLGSTSLTFQAKDYEGYGTTANRPAATLTTKNSTYLDISAGIKYRNSPAGTWTIESYLSTVAETISGQKTFSAAPIFSVQSLSGTASISGTGARYVTHTGTGTVTMPTAVIGMQFDIVNISTADSFTLQRASSDVFGITASSTLTSGSIAPGQKISVVCLQAGVWSVMSQFNIGDMIDHHSSVCPFGWLWANGVAIPAGYVDAIALIGANTPDLRGRVTAGVDNMGGASDAGRLDSMTSDGDMLGITGGADTHPLTSAESGQKAVTTGVESADHAHSGTTSTIGNHSHNIPDTSNILTNTGTSRNHSAGTDYWVGNGKNSFSIDGAHNHTITTGGVSANHTHSISGSNAVSAHNNLQPTILTNKIVCVL